MEATSGDLTAWRKASYSNGSGDCVVVADTARVILIRDTKDPDGETLTFTAHAWQAFTASIKTV